YVKLHEWSKQYGPIVSFNVAGQRVVVLNSVKSAGDVLDRLSAHSSNRPTWIKLNQFLSRGRNVVGMQHGETWRRLRKAIHEVFNIRNVNALRPMQAEEATIMIRDLLMHPEIDLVKHFHRISASVVWRSLYGGDPLSLHGPDASHRVEELSTYIFKSAVPGNSLVDMIPPLRHIYNSSKHLDEWYLESTKIFVELYGSARDASVRERAEVSAPCVSNSLSRLPDDYGISSTSKAWIAGVIFSAGQDTTATTLRFLSLALLLHPEVMQKAQADLDAVVGDRMPTFEDKDRLPYISAIVKEVSRWRPAVPAGVPHAASNDFEYNGYVILRGTVLLDNIWSQTRDPDVYENPEEFDPSRFMDSDGRLKPGAPDSHDDWLGFGHGRRVCPGRDLATNTLFIAFASLLWAFEFLPAKGEVAPNDVGLIDNFITVQPAPFKVTLVPRFKDLGVKLDPLITQSC
ncbi:cytochrome P450, partial [Calocera cornea HHB12733]